MKECSPSTKSISDMGREIVKMGNFLRGSFRIRCRPITRSKSLYSASQVRWIRISRLWWIGRPKGFLDAAIVEPIWTATTASSKIKMAAATTSVSFVARRTLLRMITNLRTTTKRSWSWAIPVIGCWGLGSKIFLWIRSIYNASPPENSMILLIDISQSAFHSKMLYYAVTVLKDILAREEYNDTILFFYTYDETVHEYDFSGEEVKCTILDNSIISPSCRIN